jgi:hypothetical protein
MRLTRREVGYKPSCGISHQVSLTGKLKVHPRPPVMASGAA